MSGVFLVAGNDDAHGLSLAHRVGSTILGPIDTIREFGVRNGTVVGCVRDETTKSSMPRHDNLLPDLHIVMQGVLFSSDRQYAEHFPESTRADRDLETFADLYLSNKLRAALPKLNGQFLVIIADHRNDTIVACNDRFGLYPYYWSAEGNRFYIGPRVLGAVAGGVVPGDWNVPGVAQFLSTGDYLGDHTPISGVHAFPPGSIMTRRGNKSPVFERYWRLHYASPDSSRTIAEIGEELGGRFVESVHRQSEATDALGITLSGGLDSRCILAASASLNRPIHTFTWGQDGSEEIDIARRVARQYDSIHHMYRYNYSDFPNLFDEFGRTAEGMLDLRDAHFLTHSGLCKEYVSAILNGYAGDLLLGGSYLRTGWNRPQYSDTLAERLFRWRNSIIPQDRLNEYFGENNRIAAQDLPIEHYKREIAGIDQELTPDIADTFFLENRVRRSTSMGTVLMRRHVESFSPFFDYDFVDFVMTIPPHYRIDHRAYRAMIRSRFAECAANPWNRTMLSPLAPFLLMQVSKAKIKVQRSTHQKLGIRIGKQQTPVVDFASLFQEELRDFVRHEVLAVPAAIKGLFNIDKFREQILVHSMSVDRSALIGVFMSMVTFGVALDAARSRSVDRGDIDKTWTRLY